MLKCLEFLSCIWEPKEEVVMQSNIKEEPEIPPELYLSDLLEQIEEKDKPQELVLKEASFDISKIKSYCPDNKEDVKKYTFRPENFNQFIGQENNKENIKLNIQRINMGIKTHFLFDAIQGHGKTTMAYLIAKELDAKLIERVGQQICDEDLINIINEINSSQEKNIVFFVDEIETIKPKYLKTLNPILEDFTVAGKQVKPFIFIGATINKHILIKRSSDTLDRLSTHIRFSRYTPAEITQIVKQYKQQMYDSYNVPNEVITRIAQNCKLSPRISITMLEDYLVIKDVDKLLRFRNIVKDGLNIVDIKILKVLHDFAKPMGNGVKLLEGLNNDTER